GRRGLEAGLAGRPQAEAALVAERLTVYAIRHADAGDRANWSAPDRLRPLSKKGFKQAAGLVSVLKPYPIRQVATSPYVRCRQTVEALAAARDLELVESDALAE